MTYIDYLNTFNRWLEDDNPTDKAVVLYYALLNMFNSRGWPRWAGVDTQKLMILARASNKPTALRARDALVEAGFLAYKPGKKGKATEYRLLKYGNKFEPESVTENVTESVTESVTENVTKNVTPNKTKNITPPVSPPRTELEAAFADWLAYKDERRESYKPVGLRALQTEIANNARRYGEAAVASIIRQSMASGWKGIAFDRLTEQRSGGGNIFLDMLREEEARKNGTY